MPFDGEMGSLRLARTRRALPLIGCDHWYVHYQKPKSVKRRLDTYCRDRALTRDQVQLLRTDKVVSGLEPTLGDLGVQSRHLEEFLQVLRGKFR
jgi:hypothetical protein